MCTYSRELQHRQNLRTRAECFRSTGMEDNVSLKPLRLLLMGNNEQLSAHFPYVMDKAMTDTLSPAVRNPNFETFFIFGKPVY